MTLVGVEDTDASHGGEANAEDKELPDGMLGLLVEFGRNHFNARDKEEGTNSQTVQSLDHDFTVLTLHGHLLKDHAENTTDGSERGVKSN